MDKSWVVVWVSQASLVQIIKLLEPFETLVWTRLLLPSERNLITMEVLSILILTIGAALALVHSRKKTPHPYALVFAILAGVTLSSRKVWQRRLHHVHMVSHKSFPPQQQQQEQQQPLQSSSSSSPPSEFGRNTKCGSSPLQKALEQFTLLSLRCSCTLLALIGVLEIVLVGSDSLFATAIRCSPQRSVQAVLPLLLYAVFFDAAPAALLSLSFGLDRTACSGSQLACGMVAILCTMCFP